MIVSLFISLLLYRIEKMEKLLEENKALKEETYSYYTHTAKFDNILTRIESAYNLTIIIGNITISLSQNVTNQRILENIANLCSRLSLISGEIESRLNHRESTLDYLTDDERGILNTYLEDTLEELKRVHQRIVNKQLIGIIENNILGVENIMDLVGGIEKKG